MAEEYRNPMSEYLFKIQMIVSNTEFKNKEEADKYETLRSRLQGDAYVRAMTKTDMFESYEYDTNGLYTFLIEQGIDEQRVMTYIKYKHMIPHNLKSVLLIRARKSFIKHYSEPNKYYLNLSGRPLIGTDEVVLLPDEFYYQYESDMVLTRNEPLHSIPSKYLELFINSEYYEKTMNEHPNATYLKYLGSNGIPIEISRKARDGDIMRVNESKLSTYHPKFGNVNVTSDLVHVYCEIYRETRDYVYQALRGDFSSIYPNYNSLIRFLTIYMSIGNALNEFQRKSTKLIYMNNITAHNLFMLYGLPSVIMEGTPMIEFLKKFRLLLMDKGTNVVYRVKDLIGYEYTDIYTLVMVKQQVFENGIPIYTYDKETGEKIPVQNVFFRRLGTTDDNTSYFKFRDSRKEYTVEEITSGDPRWWNTPEVNSMIQDMNYTLSNSKYIQLSTHMSMADVWWECVIFIRGMLDNKNETASTMIDVNYNINGGSSMSLFDAVLTLVILMNWHSVDAYNNNFRGDMYVNNGRYNGKIACVDMLFNGLYPDNKPNEGDYGVAMPLLLGLPYKISSFNFNILNEDPSFYTYLRTCTYLEPSTFIMILDKVLNRDNVNIGEALMTDAKLIYRYLETKLRASRTIQQFRQVTDVFSKLFLVEPVRDWIDNNLLNTDEMLMQSYGISYQELSSLKTFFSAKGTTNTSGSIIPANLNIVYEGTIYPIYIYNVMNEDVYELEINGKYPFRDNGFVKAFGEKMLEFISLDLEGSGISDSIKENYQNIIKDKVELELGGSIDGPKSFEQLLFRKNISLYKYLMNTRIDNPEGLILIMRAIIKALEDYTNTPLNGLQFRALGYEEYFRILKEVISYFKSYMVEFTKEEFTYIFDGLFDNGGNSNMLRLYDEMTSGNIRIIPKDSLTLFDVSCADVHYHMQEEMSSMYDDALFRVKSKYKNLKNTGYDIWYDNGKKISKEPLNINDDTEVVANIVSDGVAYKIIINGRNVNTIPDNYYGNAY